MYTVRAFSKAVMHGSKFVYQTVPRLLTIWLDLGESKVTAQHETFKKMTDNIAKSIRDAPVYKVFTSNTFLLSKVDRKLKWFTAFPQIVSRVSHSNPEVYKYLSQLIITVMEAYPEQALWLFMSVVKSTKENRQSRGRQILDQLGVCFTSICISYLLELSTPVFFFRAIRIRIGIMYQNSSPPALQ